jgi:hypothetical protein
MSTCHCFTGTPGDRKSQLGSVHHFPLAPEPSHNSTVRWLANRPSLDLGGYEPKGTVKTLHGLNVYQALAPAVVKGEILFLPDVFGLATHNKILADEYANLDWCSPWGQGHCRPETRTHR